MVIIICIALTTRISNGHGRAGQFNLALARKPVDDNDLITLILNGMGPTYKATVNSIQAQDTPISLNNPVGLLLNVKMQHNE